jgi:hypothetical protein
MLSVEKRISKFEWYWKNDLEFRKLFYSSICSPYDCCSTKCKEQYSDFFASSKEWDSINFGMKSEKKKSNLDRYYDQKFYLLGWRMGAEGLIQKLNNFSSPDQIPEVNSKESWNCIKVTEKMFKSQTIDCSISMKEIEVYVRGMYGLKNRIQDVWSEKEWLLNMAGYERYLQLTKDA